MDIYVLDYRFITVTIATACKCVTQNDCMSPKVVLRELCTLSCDVCFCFRLQESDAECLNLSSLPLVGEADIINISFKAPDERDALRSHFKCTMEPGKEPVYHLLEVASSLKRNLYYDCLHLEG